MPEPESLTAVLPDSPRIYGGSITQGQQSVQSPLVDIAKAVGGLGEAFSAANAFGARQQEEIRQSNENASYSATNAAALSIAQVRQGQSNQIQLDQAAASPTGTPNIDPRAKAAITSAVGNINQVTSAENQGRLPGGTADLHMENAFSDLVSKYPHQAASIAAEFKSQGIDPYGMVDNAIATKQGQADAMFKAQQDNYDYAAKRGLISDGMSFEQGANAGAQQQASDLAFQASKERLEMANQQAEASERAIQSGDEHAKAIADADKTARGLAQTDLVSKAALAAAGTAGRVTNEYTSLLAMASQLGPDKQQQALSLLPQLGNYITADHNQTRLALIAAGVDEEHLKPIDDAYEGFQKGVSDVSTGTLSAVTANFNSVKNMESMFKINDATAYPLYHQLVSRLGQSGANALLLTPGAIPDKMLGAARSELGAGGMNPLSADGMVHFDRAAQILNGNMGLNNLTEDQARTQVPLLVAHVNAAPLGPKTDTTTLSQWSNGIGQLATAVDSFTPGFRDRSSLINAGSVLSSPRVQAGLEAMVNNPTTHDQGVQTAAALRIANAKILTTTQAALHSFAFGVGGSQTVQFNDSSGRYEVRFDKQAYLKSLSQPGTAADAVGLLNPAGAVAYGIQAVAGGLLSADATSSHNPGLAQASVPVPGAVQLTKVLNDSLDTLVRTSKYDPNLPTTIKEMDLRQLYANGKPLPGATGAGGKEAPKPFDTAYEAVQKDLAQAPSHTYDNIDSPNNTTNMKATAKAASFQPIVSQAAAQHSDVPRITDAINYTAQHESSWDPNADSKLAYPNSPQARGLMQIQKGTAEKYGLKVSGDVDERLMPEKAIPAMGNYLAELHEHYGNWVDAFKHYGTLARGNFKTTKEYQDAVAEARNEFGDS